MSKISTIPIEAMASAFTNSMGMLEENMLSEKETQEMFYTSLKSDNFSQSSAQGKRDGDTELGCDMVFRGQDMPYATPKSDDFSQTSAQQGKSDGDTEPGGDVFSGQDIGDLPVQYVVQGLRPHELPVIGFYVDPRVIPGFRYRVRHLVTERHLFDGRALTLQSIGLGYGKRLTFAGDSFIFNDNFFWSDSDPSGFAFSLDAVQPRCKLTVYSTDAQGVIGEVRIDRILGSQKEISSEVVNGDVIKRVGVTMECNVTYYQRQHSGVNFKLHGEERLSGEAIVIKRKKTRVAALDHIHNVTFACVPHQCTLQVES